MKLAMCSLVSTTEGGLSRGGLLFWGKELVIQAPFSTLGFSAHLQCPTTQVFPCKKIEKYCLFCHQGSVSGICAPAATMHT